MRKFWLFFLFISIIIIFPGCVKEKVALNELQVTACDAASEHGTCDRLEDLGIVTATDCCNALDKCCKERSVSGLAVTGRCGDGICDSKEKADPSLCPKDCKTQPSTTSKDSSKTPSCSISASPNPCSIPAGSSLCTSTISWTAADTADGVDIKIDESTFAYTGNGVYNKDAPWIGASDAVFNCVDHSIGNVLGLVTVRSNPPEGPTIHCNRCSTWKKYARVDFDTTDPTCYSVVPLTSPVTSTCDCSCTGVSINGISYTSYDTTWNPSCVNFCATSLNVPYSFFSVHCENNKDPGIYFDDLEKLVNLADLYKVPLTIMFNPTWVDYILADQARIDKIHSWQQNGHEIALHHHGPTHGGWNGYSNMPKSEAEALHLKWSPKSLHRYIGTVENYFPKLKQLAYPYQVKSGTVTDKWTDMPQEIIYDAEGRLDGRTSKVVANIYNGHMTYRLNLRANYVELSTVQRDEYNSLSSNEIYGTNGHVEDFFQNPEIAEGWFKFLYEKDPEGVKRKTMTKLMEDYVLPNNLVISEGCGNTLCDNEEKDGNSCTQDCGTCNPNDFLKCTCANTYRACEFGNATQIYLMGKLVEQTCTGTCKSNSCSSYNSCSSASGTCSSGYCCTGSCTSTIPQAAEISPFAIHGAYIVDEGYFDNAFITSSLIDIGAKWVRTTVNELENKLTSITGELAKNNIKLYTGVNTESNDEIKALVSKYKSQVKYWRISNEPDSLSNYGNNPQGYVDLLKRMYPIIKQEFPDAIVTIGGLAGGNKVTETSRGPTFLKAVLQAGGGSYFDVFAFHFQGEEKDYTDLKNTVTVYKNILKSYGYDKPFWITEFGTYDGDPVAPRAGAPDPPYQSEAQQAAGMVKRYIYGLSLGIEKMFWSLIVERHNFGGREDTYFDYIGLVNNPANDGLSYKKLSYYTYKKMTEILEGSDWNNIQTIQESDGVYIYKFTKQGEPIWVAWNDNSGDKQITISGIISSQIKITEAVPNYESGKDVTDYGTAFNTETESVSSGQITIALKDKPVFIEEEGGASQTCADTDGGFDLYVAGICTDNNGSHQDYCLNRFANDNTQLEFYCSGNACISALTGCAAGCSNSACLSLSSCKSSGQSCSSSSECCSGLICSSGKCTTTTFVVSNTEFLSTLLQAIRTYFSDSPTLTTEELKDLIVAYFSIEGDTVGLSGTGQYSKGNLMDIYNKAKGIITTPQITQQELEIGISIAGFLNDQGDGFSGESLSLNFMKESGADTVRFMSRWGGIHWAQVEPKKGVFDWSIPDEHYLKAKENGLDIFVNIYPDSPSWDSNSEYEQEYPNDMEEYLKFVKLAAERYDGDGIEDASGNPKVNTWELLVELERNYWAEEDASAGGNKWWGGTPEEYADLFVKTYEAIKSVNPDATVMTYGSNMLANINKEGVDAITKPVLKEIKRLTKDNPNFSFVYAIHYYETSDLNEYREIIEYTRAMLDDYGFENTPIAITDMAPFIKKTDPLKEQKVAKDIFRTYVVGLAHNIKTIIWAQLSDGLEYGKNFEAGLISNPSMTPRDEGYYKNLGFYTYKLMTEKLEGSDWNNIQTIQEKDGVYVYKFTKQGKSIWVAWNDNSQEKQITISGITLSQVKITEAVPKYESGKDVAGYNTAFNTKTKNVSGDKITITLGNTPLFIEEQ